MAEVSFLILKQFSVMTALDVILLVKENWLISRLSQKRPKSKRCITFSFWALHKLPYNWINQIISSCCCYCHQLPSWLPNLAPYWGLLVSVAQLAAAVSCSALVIFLRQYFGHFMATSVPSRKPWFRETDTRRAIHHALFYPSLSI